MFLMVDYLREMTVKKSCKYSEYEFALLVACIFCLCVCFVLYLGSLSFVLGGCIVLPVISQHFDLLCSVIDWFL